MARYQIIVEYDGKNHSGWQSQKNAKSIQKEIETILADEILFGKLEGGGEVSIDLKKDQLIFKYS